MDKLLEKTIIGIKFTDLMVSNPDLKEFVDNLIKQAKQKERERILSIIESRTINWEFINKDCVFCERMDKLIDDLRITLKSEKE